MNIDQLRCMFLPVNTVGRQKRSDMEAIERAYRDENVQMMSFPAGFCSRFIDGKIQDIPWKKSVITKAIDSKRDVIPMYFKGRNSLVFYALVQAYPGYQVQHRSDTASVADGAVCEG